MKVRLLITLLAFMIPVVVFSQAWQVDYTPRFRKNMEIKVLSMENVSLVGGWPENDSITYMSFSSDGGENWTYQDIFPGKQLNSALWFNSGKAVAAGLNGAWYISNDYGQNWETGNSGINLDGKNIESFHMGLWGTYFSCGGYNETNGFIIISEDYGTSWNFISTDNSMYFNDIHSTGNSNNNLTVCGNLPELLFSENQGEGWTSVPINELSADLSLNALDFFDGETGICVGGKAGADSIQVILRSTSGGESWTVVRNITAPGLNDVQMLNDSLVYAVGDDGCVLFSEDAGLSWETVSITDNPELDLFSVSFINQHFGYISGDWGLIIKYNDGNTAVPQAITSEASSVTPTSARLNASINAGFLDSEVWFEYGTDESMSESLTVGTYSDGSTQSIKRTISELDENTHYHYRVVLENDYGRFNGEMKLFYTGNPIPNWDFELWDEISKDFPENWLVNQSEFEKVDYSGNHAIRLSNENAYQNDDVSAVMNAEIEGEDIEAFHIPIDYISGGLTISERPDSIFINAKYNIDAQDSAMLFVGLILDDHYVSENFFFITGNQAEFQNFGFEIDYLTGETPTKAVIAITNSNPFDTLAQYNSSIEISEIWFKNDSPVIPNSNFENWNTSTAFMPEAWYMETRHIFGNDGSVLNFTEQSTDAAHHDYAIKLQNKFMPQDTVAARISLKDWNQGIPIDKRFSSFSGQYKYLPEAQDTARLFVTMYHNNEQCGWGHFENHETKANWTGFSAEIHYDNEDIIPDSMNFFIEASQWPPTGESQLFVDKLSLDGDFIPVDQSRASSLSLYPNPVNRKLHLSQPLENINIYDTHGKLIKHIQEPTDIISTEIMSPGIYIIKTQDINLPFIKK